MFGCYFNKKTKKNLLYYNLGLLFVALVIISFDNPVLSGVVVPALFIYAPIF